MSYRIIVPDPDSRFATKDGLDLYAKDFRGDMPLYRNIKLLAAEPYHQGRRTAHLTWIVHMGRCRGGADAWLLQQHRPEIRAWIEQECAAVFDAQYVQDTLGIDAAEYALLVDAEHAKYK